MYTQFGLNTKGELGTQDNTERTIYTRVGDLEIISNPEEIILPLGQNMDISIEATNSFNLKTDIAGGTPPVVTAVNTKEIDISKIEGVDNKTITDIKEILPNYKVTGNKIGRTEIIAKDSNGNIKNIWVNVVNDQAAKVSSKVANGENFTIALRSNGEVFGFGSINSENNPKKIEVPEEVVDIEAGRNHVMILGKSGKVYVLGANQKGQLGNGNLVTANELIELKSLENICKIIAKENTSYAINKDGKLFAWGEGYTKVPSEILNQENVIDAGRTYFLTDEGTVKGIKTLQEIAELPEKIVQISEGIDHILLLGETGKVYGYGKNDVGQLGNGGYNTTEVETLETVKTEDANILENIKEVSAGDRYSIVVTNERKCLYIW